MRTGVQVAKRKSYKKVEIKAPDNFLPNLLIFSYITTKIYVVGTH